MAVTGFWPVYRNLKATLDYADNPDKTTLPEYLDEDLYAALRYVENDSKTDRQMFVGGINCSKQNAYAEMIAVQRRFDLRGKVVGYHGIQSFREGEVTPEQAFAIGKETARRMWGDRYQVLVTVHLNTDNIHCHFVVNPVSFKDGAKFQNKIGDHKELRRDLSRYVFAKECAIRIDKQQKERCNNVVIDNDVISLSHVNFSYGSKSILRDVSLTILEKTTVAIVGLSGSGKTTLCNLMARFWDVQSGSVRFGGRNVREYSYDSLIRNFSFVFQRVYLFSDTIANNIRFGKPDASMEEVQAAAKKARCYGLYHGIAERL